MRLPCWIRAGVSSVISSRVSSTFCESALFMGDHPLPLLMLTLADWYELRYVALLGEGRICRAGGGVASGLGEAHELGDARLRDSVKLSRVAGDNKGGTSSAGNTRHSRQAGLSDALGSGVTMRASRYDAIRRAISWMGAHPGPEGTARIISEEVINSPRVCNTKQGILRKKPLKLIEHTE